MESVGGVIQQMECQQETVSGKYVYINARNAVSLKFVICFDEIIISFIVFRSAAASSLSSRLTTLGVSCVRRNPFAIQND